MARGRAVFAGGLTVAVVLSVALGAQTKEEKQKADALKKEIQLSAKLVDAAVAGQPAPNDLGLAWAHEDFIKAASNKEYVPFTVTIDTSKVTSPNVALYWRTVLKTAPPAPGQKAEKKDEKASKDTTYEGASFATVTPGAPLRVSRSFSVPGGVYDVYVVAKEPIPSQKNAPPAKVSVLKQTVTVPDYWNGDFTTSTVIIAQRIDPLPAPLTLEQQAERPYALGMMEIIPVPEMKFTKKGELSTFMLIYNPKTDAANKPDVLIEYTFCQVAAGNQPKPDEPCKTGEKFFNKTNPASLNASTLPPQFDLALGHQLQTGQAVPLAAFSEGDYRLEIKVTDKIANKSIVRDVNFTVGAS